MDGAPPGQLGSGWSLAAAKPRAAQGPGLVTLVGTSRLGYVHWHGWGGVSRPTDAHPRARGASPRVPIELRGHRACAGLRRTHRILLASARPGNDSSSSRPRGTRQRAAGAVVAVAAVSPTPS
jgi:hypothetical protein